MPRRALCIGAGVVLWGIAAWVRLQGMPEASALGDAMHPWWAALRSGWPRAHAPPYGWALLLPYKACMWGAGDLWTAVQRMMLVHALAAPVAAWMTWRVAQARGAAVLVGLLVAFDPGLLDTVHSGAEGYLGPLLLGLVGVGVVSPGRLGAFVALVGFAGAVMNHPLAICAAPLLLGLRWRERSTWAGAVLALLLLAPRLVRLFSEPLPGGAMQGLPGEAVGAYLSQGGPVAVAVVLGPVLGMFSQKTRPLAVRTLASLALLGALGVAGGYLRDHHLRLLTIPALAGWAWVGWPGVVALLGLLVMPWGTQGPPPQAERPGTLGLTRALTHQIHDEVAPPLVVDGAWLSGGPAASPAAIMLDLHLRGWTSDELRPGHTVVVVVSGTRDEVAALDTGTLMVLPGERHALLSGSIAAVAGWSAKHCQGRLGGAWDALSVLHPSLEVQESRVWWACP